MMRLLATGIAVVLFVLVPKTAFGVDVTVSDLVADGAAYANIEVTVLGELVGDYGHRRDGFTWTQLNGDGYAHAPVADGGPLVGSNVGIGIRMPTDLADGLDPPGRYRTVGPQVRVTGVWKYHDPVRQGETYLDVVALETIEQGRSLHEPPLWGAFAAGFVLLAATAWIWRRYTRKRDAVQ
jgi:hypothetical protein